MGEDSWPETNVEAFAGDWIGLLLAAWQASGDPARLELVVTAVRQVIEAVATRTLARCHVADRSAVDDVVSLVLDHIRRLPCGAAAERPVAVFRGYESAGGRGLAYIRLLSRNRAIDVVRSRRRHERHGAVFSALDDDGRRAVAAEAVKDAAGAATADIHERLLDAVTRLEPPLRDVVQLLLDGKSQTVIAHMLDVCDGTVSRLRRRAIDRLRHLLAE